MSILPPAEVIIFGEHSPVWMQALGPQAPVWPALPRVGGISVVPAAEALAGRVPAEAREPPILIPLLEAHIRTRPAGFRELSPSEEALGVLANKRRFAGYARARGLEAHVPATFERLCEPVFPCLVKPSEGRAGKGIEYVGDAGELDELLSDPAWRGRDFVVQQFLDVPVDHVTYCVCREGEILWHQSFAYRPQPPVPVRGPRTALTGGACRPPDGALDVIARFLAPLRFDGPCNVDYKLMPDGSVKILEINPRLGGSLMRPGNTAHLRDCLACIIDHARLAA